MNTPKLYDYAVAKALNESVNSIFSIIGHYQIIGPLEEFDREELNRAYILLVNELEELYDHNPKLADIKPEPVWRHFEIIKDKMLAVQKYLEEHDTGHDHIIRIEKLCIISGQETPVFSAKQQKFVDNTKIISAKYNKLLVREVEKIIANSSDEEKEEDPRNRRFWCVEKYTVIYKPDGTILVNNVLKLKKIHAGSTGERLLEQAVKNPNTLFKPNLGQTARNISTVLSSAGFSPTLRELFFPIVNDDKGVIFRPVVTRDEAIADRIDTYELDSLLYESGAEIAVRPDQELIDIGLAAPDEDDEPKLNHIITT